MNLSTLIVLSVILVAIAAAVIATHRAKKKKGCCGCPMSGFCRKN